jgi:hypothetical protein
VHAVRAGAQVRLHLNTRTDHVHNEDPYRREQGADNTNIKIADPKQFYRITMHFQRNAEERFRDALTIELLPAFTQKKGNQ